MHDNLRCWYALVIFATVLAAPAAGQTLGAKLIEDARDGRLDNFEFFAGALIASGVEDQAELEQWSNVYCRIRGQIVAGIQPLPPAQRLSRLQTAVKEQLLVGRYDTTASDVRSVLASGDFNCLSAAAISIDLSQAAECEATICLAHGHVWLRSEGDDSYGSTARLAKRIRHITAIELLGKFYYNRGIERLWQRRFAEGTELLETALKLDANDEDARANIAAGLNNWAVEHLRAKRLTEAAFLIERGRRLDPGLAPLIVNERLVRSSSQE